MRLAPQLLVVLVCGCVAADIAACALDESGLEVNDATADAPIDVVIPADACVACGSILAAGWQLVAFETDAGSCPSGDSLEVALENVDSGAGLCDCQCIEAAGGCSNGTLSLGYLASCGTPAQIKVDGGCNINSGTLWPGGFEATFAPANNAACIPQVIINDAAIVGTSDTLCHPSSSCDESLCSGTPPNGYAACIIQNGDVPCPSGPFQQHHLIGQGSASCSSCSCGCTGTFEYYYDNQCEAGAMVVDAACTSTSDPNASVNSSRWNSTGCVASGPRDGSVSLSNERTVCCR